MTWPNYWRTAAEFGAHVLPAPKLDLAPLIRSAPRGDGHAVLVLPALGQSDRYSQEIRTFLTALGYRTFGWDLGTNIGPTQHLVDGAAERLRTLSDVHGPVGLIGFSLGGLFARLLAGRFPSRTRQAITVGSPVQDPARNFWLPLDNMLDFWPGPDLRALTEEIRAPLPVPCTSFFTRDDGIVNWQSCIDPAADNIPFDGPHTTMQVNPQIFSCIARVLADEKSVV